jgi:DNA primase
MYYSQEFIQKIKNSLSLSKFLSRYLAIKPATAGKFKALCPFHNEKTPSFTIDDQKQNYHCFGCGAHGDILSFLTESEGYDFNSAVEFLAKEAGLEIVKTQSNRREYKKKLNDLEIYQKFTDYFRQQLLYNNQAKKYLGSRGITIKEVEQFALGYAPKIDELCRFAQENSLPMEKLIELGIFKKSEYGNSYCYFQERLVFPIKNHRGEFVAFGGRTLLPDVKPKYINSPEHLYFKKRELLYNFQLALNHIRKSKQVVVSEGYMDVIAFHQQGFYNVVAPLGTAFSPEHLKNLWQVANKVIICLDGDEAGQKASLRIIDIALPLLQAGKVIEFVLLPENQDPDDILKLQGGKEMMNNILINSKSLGEILANAIIKKFNYNKPEERAAIWDELMNKNKLIPESMLRTQYQRYFKDYFYNFFKGRFYQNNKDTKKINANFITKQYNNSELEVIKYFVFNIDLLNFDEIEEEFSLLDFSSKDLQKIQGYLLENNSGYNIDLFYDWLQKQNFVDLFKYFQKFAKIQFIFLDLGDDKKQLKYKELIMRFRLDKIRDHYKSLASSKEEQKQNLAIEVKSDIRRLETELDEILNV